MAPETIFQKKKVKKSRATSRPMGTIETISRIQIKKFA